MVLMISKIVADLASLIYKRATQIANYLANSASAVHIMAANKHPPLGVTSQDAFVSCTDLPLLIDVDVTSSHVEQVVRRLRGSGGPGGADSYHWQCFLLHYGAHSSRLREAVADLAMHLANDILDWIDI